MIVKESELPLDDATNELARVRIITSGKIVRVSELLQKARESLKAQTELRPEMQSNFLVTVYADPDRTNLCWIGFSGGFGQKRFHVEFDKSGNIVSKKVLVPSAE